ncbi:hypothetical protein DIE21_07620 [Burkholderia sp. Bp9140]|nr:hypothetical protein DIE21_07620 [Burkholderia sp. Bp9140]
MASDGMDSDDADACGLALSDRPGLRVRLARRGVAWRGVAACASTAIGIQLVASASIVDHTAAPENA